jgi:tetratricopeptide (TPR) repeat protein
VVLQHTKNRIIYIFSVLVIFSCISTPDTSVNELDIPYSAGRQTVSQPAIQQSDQPGTQQPVSIAGEIRALTETGILSSMLQAIDLIRSRDIGGTEFGRMMSGINSILIRFIYPDSFVRLPVLDLPQTSHYTRIIREAERGNYVRPSANSTDFFEYILPFLATNTRAGAETPANILRDLDRASLLQPNSVLPHYFRGKIHEQARRFNDAIAAYRQAYSISGEFYPAQIGIARVRRLTGNPREAAAILSELVIRYPDSMEIKKELALAHYDNRDFSRALSLADEILHVDPRDGEFILIKASIFMEQGQFSQANQVLDNYASINPNNRTYLFMRARIQVDGNRNRDSALNYLRSLLRSHPNDVEAMVLASTLLLDSPRASDQNEGREILERLRRISGSSIEVLNLSLRDAIRRENWREAQAFLNQVLSVRRTAQDLTDAYYIERGLGNNPRALTFARELYDRDTTNNDYTIIYISALIDNGRRDEASRLIESRLNSAASGSVKSRYFFLRSRLQTNQDAVLSDLRSSLFEYPRNLDAIIAMFEIYHNRREERRAVHYLRQALAIAPDHPHLRRYEREYSSLLGRN